MVIIGLMTSMVASLLWAQESENAIPKESAIYQEEIRKANQHLPTARQNPTRIWKGVTGGVFEGTYLRHENLGNQLVFRDKNQRELTIPLEKMSVEHVSYFIARQLLDTGEILPFFLTNQKNPPRRIVDGLKPQPERVNRTIPNLDLNNKVKFESFTEEMIILTLLWWDQNGWLAIPEGKREDDKAKWLARKLKLGNGSTLEIYQGLKKYLDEELKDHAVLQFFPKHDRGTFEPARTFSLETVKKYAVGTNACLLKLNRYERSKNHGFYYFFVTAVNGDVVSVHLDGENYNLQKKEIIGKNNEVVTEFHFTDLKQVPDWLKNSRFVVDDDWLLCITCHVFSQPGKPVPIPADMPQAESNQAVEEKPTLPSYAKKMNLIYNKQEMTGHLIAANHKVFWFWQTEGSPRLYESSKLDLASANQVLKWRYEMRQFVAPEFSWSFSLSTGISTAPLQTKLSLSRNLLWIQQSGQNASTNCIINLTTGAFASVKQPNIEAPQFMGRLDLAKLRAQAQARVAETKHEDWLYHQTKNSAMVNPVRKREMIRGIGAFELLLALEILFFPPQLEGKSLWTGIPSLYQPLAVDMIGSVGARFLIKEYDWISQGKVVPKQLSIEFEGLLVEKMPTVNLKEAEKLTPGTWKMLP